MRQQFAHPVPASFAFQVAENHFEVAAVFPEQLPARAARRSGRDGCRHDRDMGELAAAFGQCLEQRNSLGADSQPVGRVLDVAASDDLAVGGAEGRADLELRVRGDREVAGATGGVSVVALACVEFAPWPPSFAAAMT